MANYNLAPALAAYVKESAGFVSKSDAISDRREAFAEACRYFTPARPSGIKLEDDEINGLAIRIYSPEAPAPSTGWPTLLYFHGGGWSMGSHATHDWFAYAVLRRIPIAIVAVNYRLAPEHPFPAPLEDGLEVWHALSRGDFPQLDQDSLAIAGDSAGGSLAAGLCVALREMNLPQPKLQALVYPVLTASVELRSMQTHAEAPMLTTAGLLASLESYVPGQGRKADPRAFALEIDNATGLAPAFIGVAEYDPLFDHGIAYAKVLRKAGVPVHLHIGRGLVHASLRASGVAEVEEFYDVLVEWMRNSMACYHRS
ncbi:esterase [Pseudomonas jessenii]|uniref:Acetyl esterase n=1 Tax=Pseudomonas jessenii TaxID=77298 RepID=A0A231GQ03_PSEJE|nr:alpha/beta hydrolase [Pseudomonas jessenii]OXR38690.1 esterase [Pseudomonas jessenii]SEC48897.1 acetyl esterase [Pseudomonas jessenii]